jgi:hypothetical protein
MRVGIITFQHAFNYGAFLQAEALHGRLAVLGHSPEIIDYRNPALEAMHERCIRYGWNPFRKRANLDRRRRFVEALRRLNCSPSINSPEAIDWSRYDAVVYGSDEVWNFSTHCHRFDPVYFGGGASAVSRRIAYAPSLGDLDWRTAAVPREIPDLLARFSGISVRDANAVAFVEKMTGRIPPVVVDPVFLHDWPDLPPIVRPGKPFVLIYGEIRDREAVNACKAWCSHRGWTTISVGYLNPWCDRVILNPGPHEFLAWLRASEAVLTTTFHGTMFSIKFHKPFATLRTPSARNKFDPILNQLGLGERLLNHPSQLLPLPSELEWQEPNRILNHRTEESIGFLGNALE